MAEQKKKVLLVDDEESVRQPLAFSLKENGFDVLEAADGVEGLATAMEQHPDLILLDIKMPNKDGLEMLGELRQDSWGKDAAVVILTNFGDAKHVAETVQLGVFDHFLKVDWDLKDIVRAVKEKLGVS